MLTKRQIRMLQLLDKQVSSCTSCGLHDNGTAIPYWTPYSRYAIIGEAPGANEVRQQTPFVGASGEILTSALEKYKFESKDFLIVNTVQCRPVRGNTNGKPNEAQIKECQRHLRRYLKIVNPEKILCLGNYAKYIFTGNYYGILKERGSFNEHRIENDGTVFPVLFTIHPAYCIYNREDGTGLLERDIKLFKESQFERQSDWLFDEHEFLI
jgi:uracil-DNA glycosylase family 4